VVNHLSDQLKAGAVRPVGEPATDRRGADSVLERVIKVADAAGSAQATGSDKTNQ
jgi:hypothetical protein